MEEKYLL